MKRYWLFAYYTYYPNGGMKDFINSFDTVELALAALPVMEVKGADAALIINSVGNEVEYDHWHIYDSHTCTIVSAYHRSDGEWNRNRTVYPMPVNDYINL